MKLAKIWNNLLKTKKHEKSLEVSDNAVKPTTDESNLNKQIPIQVAVDYIVDGHPEKARDFMGQKQPHHWANSLFCKDGNLTTEGLEEGLKYDLQKTDKKLLLNALKKSEIIENPDERSRKVLSVLGLIKNDGTLTDRGRTRATEWLSLEDQCKCLGLELKKVTIKKQNKQVEKDALIHFRERNWDGLNCEEAPILTLLKAATVDILIEDVSKESAYGNKLGVFLEALLVRWPQTASTPFERRQLFLGALRNASETQICDAFSRFRDKDLRKKKCPEFDAEFLVKLYHALTPEVIAKLGEILSENPYAYRAGWPDLTLVREGDVAFREIKTSDRLRLSQIRMLPKLKRIIPDTSILRVTRI